MTRAELREWIVDQVIRLHAGWTELADELNHNKVPTLNGGVTWYASTVKGIYKRPTTAGRGGDRSGSKASFYYPQ